MMTADERTDGRTADKTEKQGLIRFGDFYAGMISGTCHIDDLKRGSLFRVLMQI